MQETFYPSIRLNKHKKILKLRTIFKGALSRGNAHARHSGGQGWNPAYYFTWTKYTIHCRSMSDRLKQQKRNLMYLGRKKDDSIGTWRKPKRKRESLFIIIIIVFVPLLIKNYQIR